MSIFAVCITFRLTHSVIFFKTLVDDRLWADDTTVENPIVFFTVASTTTTLLDWFTCFTLSWCPRFPLIDFLKNHLFVLWIVHVVRVRITTWPKPAERHFWHENQLLRFMCGRGKPRGHRQTSCVLHFRGSGPPTTGPVVMTAASCRGARQSCCATLLIQSVGTTTLDNWRNPTTIKQIGLGASLGLPRPRHVNQKECRTKKQCETLCLERKPKKLWSTVGAGRPRSSPETNFVWRFPGSGPPVQGPVVATAAYFQAIQ